MLPVWIDISKAVIKVLTRLPTFLGIVVLVLAFSLIAPGQKVRWPHWLRLVVESSQAIVQFVMFVVLSGPVFTICVSRNIPGVFGVLFISAAGLLLNYAAVCLAMGLDVFSAASFWPFVGVSPIVLVYAVGVFHVNAPMLFETFQRHGLGIAKYPLDETEVSPLLKMIPPEKRGKILVVKAHGKNIIAETALGEQVVRIKFGDAMDLVKQEPGIVVHRSYWIANDHMSRLYFENGNPKIETKNAQVIPVSRNMTDAIRGVLTVDN